MAGDEDENDFFVGRDSGAGRCRRAGLGAHPHWNRQWSDPRSWLAERERVNSPISSRAPDGLRARRLAVETGHFSTAAARSNSRRPWMRSQTSNRRNASLSSMRASARARSCAIRRRMSHCATIGRSRSGCLEIRRTCSRNGRALSFPIIRASENRSRRRASTSRRAGWHTWSLIKVPAGVTVRDARATRNGFTAVGDPTQGHRCRHRPGGPYARSVVESSANGSKMSSAWRSRRRPAPRGPRTSRGSRQASIGSAPKRTGLSARCFGTNNRRERSSRVRGAARTGVCQRERE